MILSVFLGPNPCKKPQSEESDLSIKHSENNPEHCLELTLRNPPPDISLNDTKGEMTCDEVTIK